MRDRLRDLRKIIIPNGHFPNNWVKQYKTVLPFPAVLSRLDFTRWKKLFLPLVFLVNLWLVKVKSIIKSMKHKPQLIQMKKLKHTLNKSPLLLAMFALVLACAGPKTVENEVKEAADFEIVKYNNPGASSFLGVGLWAWPLPMDYDGDGDMDMLVSCPDKPFNGLYFLKTPAVKTSRTSPSRQNRGCYFQSTNFPYRPRC